LKPTMSAWPFFISWIPFALFIRGCPERYVWKRGGGGLGKSDTN
jgi:hypothetical protein